jgi:hypothetical protein
MNPANPGLHCRKSGELLAHIRSTNHFPTRARPATPVAMSASPTFQPARPQGDGFRCKATLLVHKVTPVPHKATPAPHKATASLFAAWIWARKATVWARKVTLFARKVTGPQFSPWTLFQVFHPPRWRARWWPVVPLLLLAAPAVAKDDLGVFGQWAAFRDPKVPRCYAIVAAEPRNGQASSSYADVATWPKRGVRSQVHFRLSRTLHASPRLSLAIGGQRFELSGGGADAWAANPAGDAAIVAAMRSAPRMSLSAVDAAGRRFTERYSLDGVATAMDAATVGCARMK